MIFSSRRILRLYKQIISKLLPNEILIQKKYRHYIGEKIPSSYYYYPIDDWLFSFEYANEELKSQFNVKNLKGFGVEKKTKGIVSSGAILYY